MIAKGNKKRRGLLAGLFCIVMLLGCIVFVGCNDSSAQNPDEQTADYEAVIYYVNDAYVLEGDETLGKFQPEEVATISATPGGVYMEALKALSVTPKKDNYATMLKNNIKVLGAGLDTDGKTVVVDFDSRGLSGGSMEEGLLVEQIVMTLIKSFDEVEQVRFIVDGGPIETLMGHMDVTVPYGIVDVDDGEGGDVKMVMPLYE